MSVVMDWMFRPWTAAKRATYKKTRLVFLSLILATTAIAARNDEGLFLEANRVAMSRMMAGMDVKPSGDVDRDFAAAMIPHHQGAIDMAKAQLLYGRNERLRRIAQEIIVTQQQEIAAMKSAIDAGTEASK
jgi:uncharacterized protein (DUF305 family)